MFRITLLLVFVLAGIPYLAGQDAGLPTSRDASTPRKVPTPRDTIPLEKLKTMAAHFQSTFAPLAEHHLGKGSLHAMRDHVNGPGWHRISVVIMLSESTASE